LRSVGIAWRERAANFVSPKNSKNGDLHSAPGFTQNPLIFLGKGLDVFKEAGILTNGLGVDQAILQGVTVGSKKVLPSVRSSEGQK